ncbi:MAG: winged helix-turn-helix domain-containing protein [Candidatus Ranarchaeia archaeon]
MKNGTIFQVLSNPLRVQILKYIQLEERTFTEIQNHFKLDGSQLDYHI